MATSIDPQLAAIVIAIISTAGAIYAARQASLNKRDNSTIKEILANSSSVDSLDKIILALQRELVASEERHRRREENMQAQIDVLTKELATCRAAREQYYKDVGRAQGHENKSNAPKQEYGSVESHKNTRRP